MTRVTFEGHTLDTRTAAMIVALRVVTEAPVVISQGSYNTSVSQSAGTHAGGGAVDIALGDRTPAERLEIVTKARKVGFAAWVRDPSQGNWGWHCHCIAIGCPDLSSGARDQVTAYKNGRNGLANNGPDTFTRAYVNWTWEKYAATYPDLLTEGISMADAQDILNYLEVCTAQIQKHVDQVLAATRDDIKKYTAACAVSVKDYVRQTDNEDDILAAVTAVQGGADKILAAVAAAQADIDALQVDVDKVEANTAPKA